MDRNLFRSSIKEHLELSERLIAVAKEVSEKKLSIEEAATTSGIKFFDLRTKIDSINYKKEFNELKPKFEEAVREILGKPSPYGAYSSAVNKYKISLKMLRTEVNKARAIGLEEYAFDRNVNFASRGIFTYLEEKSLLDELKEWKNNAFCPCSLCALEKLSKLAYEYVQRNRKRCPLSWTHEQADIIWLTGFEMRHSDEIYIPFEPYLTCLYEIDE